MMGDDQTFEAERTVVEPGYNVAEPNFLMERINTYDILNSIKHYLQGYAKDDSGTWQKVGDPLLNPQGVNALLSICNFYINTNTIFADLDEKVIMEICYYFSQELKVCLVSNSTEWEIKDIPMTKKVLLDFIFITLTRAKDRGEAESIGKIQSIQRAKEFISKKGRMAIRRENE